MGLSFADLKKKRKNNVQELQAQLEKESKGFYKDDERYWKLKRDKNGTGGAIIRFLPSPACDGEDGLPWVRYWDHSFKGPTGRWYIEKSLTTIGQQDYIAEENTKLWATGTEEAKSIVRSRKRNLHHISNILIVFDPVEPENNGKTFLFEYGKSIKDMIDEKLAGSDDPISPKEPVNVFDFWEGANFLIKIRKNGHSYDYEKSEWAEPAPIALHGSKKPLTDKEIEEMWQGLHSLKAEIAEDKFKSQEELRKIFLSVVGGSGTVTPSAEQENLPSKSSKYDLSDDEDDDDTMSAEDYLKSIAGED